MTLLQINHLTIHHQEYALLHDLSLIVNAQDWWMILGPNGAGKTTLLQAISGALPTPPGTITLTNRPLDTFSNKERARKIGYLSQSHQARFDYSVEALVTLGRYCHHRHPFSPLTEVDTHLIEQAIHQTGLTSLRHRSIRTLSGGELQRALFAQVIAQDPQILLLDEPFNHVDLRYQYELIALIDAWRQQPDRAVIAVMHDLSLAKHYGTHGVLLNKGQVLGSGTIATVCHDKLLNACFGDEVVAWMKQLNK